MFRVADVFEVEYPALRKWVQSKRQGRHRNPVLSYKKMMDWQKYWTEKSGSWSRSRHQNSSSHCSCQHIHGYQKSFAITVQAAQYYSQTQRMIRKFDDSDFICFWANFKIFKMFAASEASHRWHLLVKSSFCYFWTSKIEGIFGLQKARKNAFLRPTVICAMTWSKTLTYGDLLKFLFLQFRKLYNLLMNTDTCNFYYFLE